LPINQKVNFSFTTFINNFSNETNVATFSLIPQKSLLRAVIADHSSMITLGTKSGTFVLSGHQSGDVSNSSLNYQWNCYDSDTNQPCYINSSFLLQNKIKPVLTEDYLLINPLIQKSATLVFNSNIFPKNRELILTLQVRDPNDIKHVSEIKMVLVKINDNNGPQLFMGSIYIISGGRLVRVESSHPLATIVPAYTTLVIKAVIKGSVKQLQWFGESIIHPLNWININLDKYSIESNLYLDSGKSEIS